MAFKLVTVLALFLLVVQVSPSLEYLVQTYCRSYSNSCRTFNDYANDADTYFTSDSSFYFMKGRHHLNVTLFITNVVNSRFVGDESDIILFNGCSIIWTASSEISWTSLNLFFNNTNEVRNNSALLINNSKVVSFSNTLFIKFHSEFTFYSRAVLAMSSSILFENCKFENGHHSKGGIIYIEDSNVTFLGNNDFLNNTANYRAGALHGLRSEVLMNGSGTFEGNRVGLLCVGTAIHVMHSNISIYGYFKFSRNQMKNDGRLNCGGGGTISTLHSSLILQGQIYFINNTNKYGGAIIMRYSKSLFSGHVQFTNNKAVYSGGAISVVHSTLIIQTKQFFNSSDPYGDFFSKQYPQSVIFCNNSAGARGGAIDLYSSDMTLTGSVIFMENKADIGGGIAIYYASEYNVNKHNAAIVFQQPLDIHFYKSVASKFGGALYIFISRGSLCKSVNCIVKKCFFKLNGSISYINLNFTGNQASRGGGPGIYGGIIQHCHVNIRNQRRSGYSILQDLTKSSTDVKSIYASIEALKIRICNGTTQNDPISIRVQRNRVYNISVEVLGEFDVPLRKRVTFTMNYSDDKSSIIASEPYNYIKVNGCRNLGFSVFSKHHIEQLKLQTYQWPTSIAALEVIFQVDDCPPGFTLTGNDCKCQTSLFKMIARENLCNSRTGRIKCPQQDWMKPILDENLTYEGFMWSPNCPAHLCRNDKDNWLDYSSDNVDFLCLEHHTAMLCGACLQNYSLTLSSLKCSNCENNNFLSLLLVFTLAGVALIAFLLLLQLTVADGTINGLIFYVNVINIIKEIIFPTDKLSTNPLTVFLSWINLDFGIPTCFYTSLNYYSYTWLQFVFPFYLWFLVGLIILACKYSSRAMKLFGSNPVAVLATVVLMSYSKLLHTSQEILSYANVYYSNGTQERRWRIDPNLLYFQGKHIPLAMFGMFVVIVFLIPYVVLMSFGYYLQKYSNKRGLKWLIKIKPILDAYYAPFCKNTHFWAGFLLFTRTCLSITYSALSNKEHITILVIVSSVLTGVVLILWLQHKLYENMFINVLEGSFILNIIVLSFTSYHIITRDKKSFQLILSHTFIGIAFIEFLAILGFHAWHRLNLKWLFMKYCKNTNAVILSSSIQCVAKVKDIGITGENASTSMIFSIREPLLDDSTEL